MNEVRRRPRPPDFEEWYLEVGDELTQRIAAATGDPVFGRELAAEAFARAYDRWARVGKMESPAGWVYRTAMNLSSRWWRRRSIERRALAKLSTGLTDLSWEAHDQTIEIAGHHPEELTELVAALPERMRIAVRLRYWDGLTEVEVAERMETTTGAASATLSQARRRLQAMLDGQPAPATGTSNRTIGDRTMWPRDDRTTDDE